MRAAWIDVNIVKVLLITCFDHILYSTYSLTEKRYIECEIISCKAFMLNVLCFRRKCVLEENNSKHCQHKIMCTVMYAVK